MGKALYTKKDRLRLLEKEHFDNGLAPEPYRTEWRRDFARLIHSPSFRRLQGKTQLFPGVESDFFRNRLTHSMEVAQIAKSIAIRLNATYNINGKIIKSGQKKFGISTDLVEFAGLAHDLGHPPFGHQGEEALDKCMEDCGGFEGNAQTVRILTKIEKKFRVENSGFENSIDKRIGLNLCMRTLASILKYDREIPESIDDRKALKEEFGQDKITPVKGYYKCDEEVVNKIQESVLNGKQIKKGDFKTLECYIMDIADDIAYSTYDLEDGLKAGFIFPLDILYPTEDLLEAVTKKVNKNLIKEGVKGKLSKDKILDLVRENIFDFGESNETSEYQKEIKGEHFLDFVNTNVDHQYRASRFLASDGSIRTGFTSSMVGRFIRGIELEYNEECPALSKAKLRDDIRIIVEILKTYTYLSQISSPRLKIAEYRGKEIVTRIFNTLTETKEYNGYELMPPDIQRVYLNAKGTYRKRIICDYIASMTDKYAIEFYGRLTSENPETIFKPF
jgi:dGTPase